jgi:hypothetical protein
VGTGGGADYHDQAGYHWIDDHIAPRCPSIPGSPRAAGASTATCWAPWWRGQATDGTVGFGVITADEIGAWIVERHLARFLEGAQVTDLEGLWDPMFLPTLGPEIGSAPPGGPGRRPHCGATSDRPTPRESRRGQVRIGWCPRGDMPHTHTAVA